MPVAFFAALARTSHGQKAIRYSMVSSVAVACSQAVLILCSGLLGWEPVPSNVTAVAVSSVPSYLLNRAWVWNKRGSHDFVREVMPFWIFAFIGLGFSTLLVHVAAQWSDATVVLSMANLTAFGLLWIAKYLFLDAVIFRALRSEDEEPVVLS